MTNFKHQDTHSAFVWIWLPNDTQPIVAGRIDKDQNLYCFTYGQSYLTNKKAIALSPFELPLQEGTVYPVGMNTMHSCLRDVAHDQNQS